MVLAETLQEMGRREEAAALAEEALKLGGARRDRVRGARVLRLCGAAEGARATLCEVLAAWPGDARALRELRLIEAPEAEPEAISAGRGASDPSADQPKRAFALAAALADRGELAEARALLQTLTDDSRPRVAKRARLALARLKRGGS